ncbi:glucan endo-1,3-beta-D-glucosidase [Mariniflexile sp. HNIBRBA6329]|uniref:glucan endo-1,3-beta-D-glucosidase n=1 Tax=Mariniflexile sp. HNIBRBA6329 TaxID=3373088 RepID=UPI00374704D5
MKNFKYIIGVFLTFLMLFTSCQDDNVEFGDLIAPTNIQLSVDIVGADATNPNGDGSGTVNFTATADNVTAIHFVVQNTTKLAPGGVISHDFTQLGLNTYPVTVIAFGTGGVSSSKTFEVEVLSTYSPPADLLTMLTADSQRTWRIKAEAKPHFGLGPVGGSTPFEWYSAGANDKVGTGMYDDRYTFNIDGTFTAVTNGTVFGREVLIDELGGSGGTADGADILNYVYGDYTEQWSLTAPGGVETISFTGLAFVGYYTGGNHKYIIHSRSSNEMVLTTTDGNNGFNWWFTLVPE